MRLLACQFHSGTEFLASYRDRSHGAVFCETRARLAVGERISVEISFPELPNPATMRGQIEAVTGEGGWVAISARDADVARFAARAARGELAADGLVRHHRRFPTEVPVRYRINELDETSPHRDGHIVDLGIGGAQIRAEAPPRVGTRVSLALSTGAPEPRDLEIAGRVAWARTDRRFGVRFDQRGPGSARPLRPMIRRIAETGELPVWASAPHASSRRDATPAP